MELFALLLLSTVLAPASCSPLVPPGAPRHAAREAVGSESSLGRREALNLGSPDLAPVDTVILHPISGKGCTTTLSETYGYPCSWDGTTSMYASTTIMFQQINCNGCESVRVEKDYYFCPNQRIEGTKWIEVPYTSWSTICRPSAGLVQRTAEAAAPAITTAPGRNPAAAAFPTPTAGPGAKDARSPQNRIQPAACPTTLVVQPERSAGKTATTYSTITTSTVTVDCGGCPLVVSTALAGYGPPRTLVTTTTLPIGAVTTYACR